MRRAAVFLFIIFNIESLSAKTLGELLKQADRGAGQKIEKNKVSLPSSEKFKKVSQPDVNLVKVKPPKVSKYYETIGGDHAQYEKILDEQIDEAFKLTKKMGQSSSRGELWLRLAELYVEKANLIDFRVQSEYDRALKEYQDGTRKNKPELNLSSARDYNKKAIQLYEWFARDFPKDKKLDQAYFFLGYNYFELGQSAKGSQYYKFLLQKFPKSQYVTETHFAMGEYYFEGEKWKLALDEYQQVLKQKRPRLYFFSLFKVAWCYYRLGFSDKALRTAEILLEKSKRGDHKDESGKIVNQSRIDSEALRDIVIFYSEAGDSSQAVSYFKGYAGDNADKYLEMLAYIYSDKGARDSARKIFHYLISQDKNSPKNFDYQYQIVQLFSTSNRVDEFKKELYGWIKDYGPESDWYRANKKQSDLIENSNRLRESTLRNWTLQHHQTAQNARTPYSQNLALDGYRLFFSEFPRSGAIADMHFYYAELLYEMGQFNLATDEYKWIIDHAEGSKYFPNAAENIVLASEKDVPADKEIEKKVGKITTPMPLDSASEKFIQSGTWYLSKFPQAKKNADIKFRIARIYYLYNQYNQAIPLFKEIVKQYPGTKFAEYSSNLLLDSYSLNKDFAGLEKTSEELLANPNISQSTAGQEIRAVMERASFKKAQDLEEKKDYLNSAIQFEEFAKSNANSTLLAAALFNAAINYERSGKANKAISMHAQLISSKNKESKKLREKSIQIIPQLYQNAGLLEQAAKTYELAADNAKTDKEASHLIYNAGLINELLGNSHTAIKNYEHFLKIAANKEKSEARFRIAELLRKRKSYKSAVQFYSDYVDSPNTEMTKVLESAYQAYFLSRSSSSEEWKKKVIRLANKAEEGSSYLAKIKLSEATDTFAQMKSIRIAGDAKKQQKSVQEKLSIINQLNQQLANVIKQDSSEEIILSLNMLGDANWHLAQAFLNAPVPKGLSSSEADQYKKGVESVVTPFIDKAKESYASAVSRGSELHTYNEGYWNAYKSLAKINPEKFKLVTELPLSYSVFLNSNGEVMSGDASGVFNQSTNALSENPKDVSSLMAMSWYHWNKNQMEAAKYFLERAKNSYDSAEVYNNLAILDFAVGDKNSAFKKLRKAFELKPKNKYIAAHLGCAYSVERDFSKSIIPLETAFGSGFKNLPTLSNYALALTEAEKLNLAESRYKEAYSADSFNKEMIYNYSVFLVRHAKKNKDGLEMINRLKFLGTSPEMKELINQLENEAKAVK